MGPGCGQKEELFTWGLSCMLVLAGELVPLGVWGACVRGRTCVLHGEEGARLPPSDPAPPPPVHVQAVWSSPGK